MQLLVEQNTKLTFMENVTKGEYNFTVVGKRKVKCPVMNRINERNETVVKILHCKRIYEREVGGRG